MKLLALTLILVGCVTAQAADQLKFKDKNQDDPIDLGVDWNKPRSLKELWGPYPGTTIRIADHNSYPGLAAIDVDTEKVTYSSKEDLEKALVTVVRYSMDQMKFKDGMIASYELQLRACEKGRWFDQSQFEENLKKEKK